MLSLPIAWRGDDLFTHMLVTGTTRTGKTATILKPMIYQLLLLKKRGVPLGLSVVEPKGDVAQMVNDMCEEMEIPHVHIDPFKPNTHKFNPMEGDTDSVAEATVVVLKGLFGKQDAFFATVQELSARNVTKLLKELRGDKLDITDVMNTLRDPEVLKRRVAELRARDGETDLVHFFESELLGSMADKYRQFVIGLRAQLENIVSNKALRHIMTGQGDINIDKHFSEGGVLAVNTALGLLRKSGDAFGQFMIMHLQNGTFRRSGTEKTRIPHFLIVDEYSRYINPDVEIFLSLAAEYRVAGIFATQSLGQLEIESGQISAKAMKHAILTNCRNKIVFGGLASEDAKQFAEEFGKDKVIMRQSTYKNRIMFPRFFPDHYRDTEQDEYRFDYTDIMDSLPRFHYIHKLVQDGKQQPPSLGMGSFVPRNWKELREWEDQSPMKALSKVKKLLVAKPDTDKATSAPTLVDATEEKAHQYELNPNDKPNQDLSHLENMKIYDRAKEKSEAEQPKANDETDKQANNKKPNKTKNNTKHEAEKVTSKQPDQEPKKKSQPRNPKQTKPKQKVSTSTQTKSFPFKNSEVPKESSAKDNFW